MSDIAQQVSKIGIIMLNTNFARPKGDVGNLASYRYPAQIYKLTKANVANVVCDELAEELVEEVLNAALSLKAQGATVITTSCGFLASVQQRVQQAVELPFLASSLCLLPFLRQVYGTQSTIGVVTFNSQVLSADHFNGHYDEKLVIAGIEQGQELHQVIKEGRTELDMELAEQDVLAAARELLVHQPACILLECTNLSPYKAALREILDIPVYDLVDAVHWLADARG